jgi:hypothetical protein
MAEPTADAATSETISSLRANPRNLHIANGLGPLLAAAVLFALMLLLAPSVAPEHVVQRPVGTTVAAGRTP